MADQNKVTAQQSKYDRLIAAAQAAASAVTIVAHPCDEASLRGALEAAENGLIVPVLVGREGRIRKVAEESGLDLKRASGCNHLKALRLRQLVIVLFTVDRTMRHLS